jgi:acyl dehydratase
MYRVTARNFSDAHENRIHSDEIARRYGFTGALVPGVAVWGHMTQPMVAHHGAGWLSSGHAAVRFHKPAYHGDELQIRREETSTGERVECRNAAGHLLAELTAPPDPDRQLLPSGPLESFESAPLKPAGRPLMEWKTVVEGERFIPWDQELDGAENRRHCVEIDESLPLYGSDATAGAPTSDGPLPNAEVVHPHWLLSLANRALTREYVMPAWIHVSSEIRFRQLLRVGDRIRIHALVEKKWERKGHQFARLLLRYVRLANCVGGAPELATEVSHSAIFRVAE